MKVYLLNLDGRPDRLFSSIRQLEERNIEFERLAAVNADSDFNTKFPYVTPNVAAIWLSHLKALNSFLESDEERCLILEDDFLIRASNRKLYAAFESAQKFDLFQIGFLNINFANWIGIKWANVLDLSYKILNAISKFVKPFFPDLHKKFLLTSQDAIPYKVVLNSFLPGAHAYIVSREFATNVINFNNPLIFSTDQFFMSLASMRSFKTARLRKSLISQSGSISSVTSRFISQKIE